LTSVIIAVFTAEKIIQTKTSTIKKPQNSNKKDENTNHANAYLLFIFVYKIKNVMMCLIFTIQY